MLRLRDVALRRGEKLLFSGADATIHAGYKVGVTGANGVGKSSLLALIVGEIQPDAGECHVPQGWELSCVEQEGEISDRSAVDYVLDGDLKLRQAEHRLRQAELGKDGIEIGQAHAELETLDGYSARSRAGQVLHGLGFDPDQIDNGVDSFSGGWRMRLGIARALMRPADLLLLDEPTNHLDLDAILWLEQWLLAFPGTLLMISHDRDFLDRVCDHILHIEHGKARLYNGDYSAFEKRRAEYLANQTAQYQRQQREIKHMQSYIDRFRYKANKARQAQSRLKALERMTRIVPAHVDSPFRFSLLAPRRTEADLIKLDQCAVAYGEQPILEDVTLHIMSGDRIGLLGANGAGKSTLIKLLSGQLLPAKGLRHQGKHAQIGYFAQSQLEQLEPALSPIQHLTRLAGDAGEQDLRDYLGGFGFPGEQAKGPVRTLSGGEKSRLVLALMIYQRPNLLLLDEPTNHLDLEMRQALALALQDFSGAVVLVSHDRHLLRVTCDDLLLVDGGRVSRYENSLDDYARWLSQRNRPSSPPTSTTASDASRSAGHRKERRQREAVLRSHLRPLVQSVKKAEGEMDRLHLALRHAESAMADNELYEDSEKGRLKELLQRRADLERSLERAEQDWLSASEMLEKETKKQE